MLELKRCCHFGGSLSLRLEETERWLQSNELLPLRWQPFIEAWDNQHQRKADCSLLPLRWQPFIEARKQKATGGGSRLLPLRWQPFIEADTGFAPWVSEEGCCHFGGSLSLRLRRTRRDDAHHMLLPLRWQPFIEAPPRRHPERRLPRLLPLRWQPFIEA